MRRVVRFLLALVLIAFGGPFGLPIVAGVGVYRLGNAIGKWQADKAAGRLDSRPERAGLFGGVKRHYWRNNIPVGMNINPRNDRNDVRTFEVNGMKDLITGKVSFWNGKVDYSFPAPVDNPAVGKLAAEFKSNGSHVSFDESSNGYETIHTDSPEAALALAKAAYPVKEADVKREVREVDQYIVNGATYEEALAKFKADRENGIVHPIVSNYLSVSYSVDGKALEPVISGRIFGEGDKLRPGEWIINDERLTMSNGKVEMPVGVRQEDLPGIVVNSFSSASSGVSEVKSRSFEDGTGRVTARYLTDESLGRGNRIDFDLEHFAVSRKGNDLKAYIVIPSMDVLQTLAGEGKLAKGSYIVVGTESPDISQGKMAVELDFSNPVVRETVRLQNPLDSETLSRGLQAGFSEADIEYSRLIERARSDGYVTAGLTRDFDLSDTKVNGVPMNEFIDRLNNPHLLALEQSRQALWLQEAAKIQAVNVEVDAMKMEMRITSVVDGGSKVEKYKLSEKEIQDFAKRGAIPKEEMKDFLMQIHPDYFRTYSDGNGNSIFADPVKDFLIGKKPTLAADAFRAAKTQKTDLSRTMKPVEHKAPRLKTS